ncbi:DUF6268 family outer membrane beta-barrel protein [Flavobacterium piscisymbiosum]|uniref:DUF6268 family outer membrane beta-barrel protein n=1 Tax=Flavobacterium piscisymbiosum TaxID=2893753 RepID=A0ABS8MCR6_9FLAO|nr:DUF6268 family outer membrane beta-barrel protein [Flavobacterium sp. F-30]MCC9063189.1 DUF6268 family outer membrane beta-barrel protein [Flavobacterium sp. F-30]
MKTRFLICSVFLISIFNMKAQENFSVNANIKTEPTDKIEFNETNIGVSFTKEINAKNKITNTLEYSNLKVNYELDSNIKYGNLDQFNQIKNKFEFSHELSNATNLNFSITPTVNFQSNLDSNDFTLLGSFVMSQKLNSKTSVNLGISRTTAFGSPKFLPVLSLNYNINNKASLLIGFPDSKISYSNNIRNKFSLSNSFNGNYYHLDPQKNLNDNASKVSLSQMTSALEYERNVDKNWFLNFKAGYDFDKKYNLIDNDNHKVYDFNTGNGYVLGVGIKYKQ